MVGSSGTKHKVTDNAIQILHKVISRNFLKGGGEDEFKFSPMW